MGREEGNKLTGEGERSISQFKAFKESSSDSRLTGGKNPTNRLIWVFPKMLDQSKGRGFFPQLKENLKQDREHNLEKI